MNTPILKEKDLPIDQLREIGLEKNGELLLPRKDILSLIHI